MKGRICGWSKVGIVAIGTVLMYVVSLEIVVSLRLRDDNAEVLFEFTRTGHRNCKR